MSRNAHKPPEIHPAIREHLAGLNMNSDSEIYDHLFPRLSDLPSPFLFTSMDKACELIINAMVAGHDILIWGDYDVDGITGTSMLYNFFKSFDITPQYFSPDRLKDGYGLNKDTLKRFAGELREEKVLITVDCGISNSEELLLAKRYGFTTIVTDHHQVPRDELHADATINPQREDCRFPYANLAGVGVAFYLLCAVRSKIRERSLFKYYSDINLKSFLAYVAIGTIADIMPLDGINRILVKGGFETIQEGGVLGIDAIFKTLNIDNTRFGSESVAFKIAPAINAAGRLGESTEPFRMFTADTMAAALTKANTLVSLNNRRKAITTDNIETALHVSRKQLNNGDISLVLLEDFHDGILGILASRIIEEFNTPALVCCYDPLDKNRIKGSGRAPEGYDLYGLLAGCSSLLMKYGGHECAAGFSLSADKFLEFKQLFDTLTAEQKTIIAKENKQIQRKHYNLSLSDSFNQTLLNNLLLLEPTGESNPQPIFQDNNTRFVSYTFVGKDGAHLRGVARGKTENIQVIGFGLGSKAKELDLTNPCAVTYGHSLDHYKGKSRWKIQIFDIWQ